MLEMGQLSLWLKALTVDHQHHHQYHLGTCWKLGDDPDLLKEKLHFNKSQVICMSFFFFFQTFKFRRSLVKTASVLSRFSSVQLFVTLWVIALQAPLSMGFSRQEYWSGLPCPPPRHLPYSGIESTSLMSPALAGGFFTTSATLDKIISIFSALSARRQYICLLIQTMFLLSWCI